MTLPASISLLLAGIALFVALLARQFSRAPGWEDQRHFALVAIAVSGYTILNIPATAPIFSDEWYLLLSRLQFAVMALHTAAWLRYSTAVVGRPGSPTDGRLLPILFGLAAAGALTPALVAPEVFRQRFAPLGVVYRNARLTLGGELACLFVLGLLLVPVARFARAWRRGVANAGVQLAALVTMLLMGVNDLLVLSGVYSAPYVVDLAFLLPITAVGYALTSRFVGDARALQALRDGLERQVTERTAELGRTQEALHRAEKLAAIGQFSAGVAHEVNNPASVLAANLQYVQEEEGEVLTQSGRSAVSESIVAVKRIAAIVRQLLDAGRLAATPEPRSAVPLRPLVEGALSMARVRFGCRVGLENAVQDGVHVSAQEGVLAQVFANLVVNAVQAVPEGRSDGRVTVRAEMVGERVRVLVEDNGSGMAPDVLRRAFEPFFTTKPVGGGTGLGLAVSRGIIASLGGELRLESEPGEGTRAIVELVRAAPPAARVAEDVAKRKGAPRLRLLVVDDEEGVLRSLKRLLESRYRVQIATGLVEGLSKLQSEEFDVVLCDVMMPTGGGEQLYRSLLARAPALAARVVFFTGGAVNEPSRRFLLGQPRPVLLKPLDLEALGRIAEQMCGARSATLPVEGSEPLR